MFVCSHNILNPLLAVTILLLTSHAVYSSVFVNCTNSVGNGVTDTEDICSTSVGPVSTVAHQFVLLGRAVSSFQPGLQNQCDTREQRCDTQHANQTANEERPTDTQRRPQPALRAGP